MSAKKVMTPGWLDEGFRHILLPYTQMQTVKPPLPVVSAKGSRLTLADGRELLDGVASWWTTAHGYRHPHIEAAVTAQLQKLPHVMLGGFAHRSEEHTSELQSLMRISYAVFCLKKKNKKVQATYINTY